MGVKDKKINIIGVHWKILFLLGVYKCIAQKGGAWTICRFKRRLEKKRSVDFLEGDDIPMYTMILGSENKFKFWYQ